MGPEGIILVNPPITTLQQSLTHSALDSHLGLSPLGMDVNRSQLSKFNFL